MASRTRYEDLPEPQPPAYRPNPSFVHAVRIRTLLQRVAELYHAGTIDYAEFSRRNHALWDEAQEKGIANEVTRQLRLGSRI